MVHMKEQKIFLAAGIIFFTSFSFVLARADGGDQAVADATLTAYELGATPADQPLKSLPRWKSSLGEIQRAAATLLETNSKLNSEARQVKAELDLLQSQVQQQRTGNAALSDEIEQVRGKARENGDPDDISRLKEVLADRGREIQAQKEILASLKAREDSIESRLALARLRMAGLEVDKKARDVDSKFRDEALINAARAQLEATRDKIAKGETQVRLLGEKTAELNKIDNPYAAQAREIVAKNAKIRDHLADLQAQKSARQVQFEQVAASKMKAEKEPNVLRVQGLLSRRNELQVKLKENSEQLEALKAEAANRVAAMPDDVAADMGRLQKQNAAMADELGNLRENVALLEYKVTTLQRYTDRNKDVPSKR